MVLQPKSVIFTTMRLSTTQLVDFSRPWTPTLLACRYDMPWPKQTRRWHHHRAKVKCAPIPNITTISKHMCVLQLILYSFLIKPRCVDNLNDLTLKLTSFKLNPESILMIKHLRIHFEFGFSLSNFDCFCFTHCFYYNLVVWVLQLKLKRKWILLNKFKLI